MLNKASDIFCASLHILEGYSQDSIVNNGSFITTDQASSSDSCKVIYVFSFLDLMSSGIQWQSEKGKKQGNNEEGRKDGRNTQN